MSSVVLLIKVLNAYDIVCSGNVGKQSRNDQCHTDDVQRCGTRGVMARLIAQARMGGTCQGDSPEQ